MPEKTLNELQVDVAILEERLKQQKEASEKALILQANAYEKHLAALNHEADQLKSMQSTYIPREVYERDNMEVQGKLDKLTKWQDVMSGRIIGFGLAWTILIAIIQWYIKSK